MTDESLEVTERSTHEIGVDEDIEDKDKKWYVIHTYSGYENKVSANLLKKIESRGMKDYIAQVLIPTEDEVEIKDGKKRLPRKRFIPDILWLR